eukprot:gene12989-14242_t
MLTCIQNDFQNNDGYSGIFIIEPLDLGQGITLGNAIRRVLLSDISGPAITGVRINNLKHEFKAIEGVREDALEILLNIKEIIFREKYSFDKPIDLFQKAYLKVKGPCIVTANMLKLPFEKLQIVNPNQYICTLTKNLKLYIELDIEKGKGYRLYDHEVVQIGEEFFDPIKSSTLKVDALFMPIKRVNYKVKLINDSKGNLKESLILEIVTNGSITPKRALQESLKALIDLIYPLFLTQNFLDISSQITEHHVPKCFVINAEGKTLGRLATTVSKLLRGKENSFYTPGIDQGNFVVITNAKKIKVSGKKEQQKLYYRNSQRPGNLKVETFSDLKNRLPIRILEEAIWGMLPKNKNGLKLIFKILFMTNNFYKGIGKRKTAIAKVILKEGTGVFIINNKNSDIFFKDINEEAQSFKTPLILSEMINKCDLTIFVKGGGITAQLDAIKLGISKALCEMNNNFRYSLKQNFFLHRDSRIKERRKYGLKKARKASQYSKR